jgi:hypothetical protein
MKDSYALLFKNEMFTLVKSRRHKRIWWELAIASKTIIRGTDIELLEIANFMNSTNGKAYKHNQYRWQFMSEDCARSALTWGILKFSNLITI